ncbi:MAG TPA: SDR family oxidoreductase [Actinomycetes bacterium]|jgi:NAD(P)-dependent dehydrogenase (short-subunit alcohol dehydrogenase family)|nr:SDR family oxidoreductase [Actinomycetes bacterium]
MLLKDKHAVVYGAGGPIGAAVAHTFAREGARVSLAGRTRAKLDALARDITAASGNVADIAQVDALDERAVQRHASRLAEQVGGLDICFNAVGDEATLGPSLTELPFADFLRPISRLVTAQFLIATAVARHMIHRNSGVILTMTGSGVPTAGMGGAMTAWAAVDALCGQLARELGPRGIRVLWLRSNGVTGEEGNPTERARSMLDRLASPDDVANVAAFLASGRAATMTATAANITSGAEAG